MAKRRMTLEEAKKVFWNRGFIKVDGGEIYDGEKWREACLIISLWLKQEPKTDVLDKIRTEIAEYKDDKIIHDERNEMIDIVLEIIDKYKAESEEA